MKAKFKTIHSSLFMLRIWLEDVGNGRSEIRSQVKHVLTGETAYFREWSALLAFLQKKLIAAQEEPHNNCQQP